MLCVGTLCKYCKPFLADAFGPLFHLIPLGTCHYDLLWTFRKKLATQLASRDGTEGMEILDSNSRTLFLPQEAHMALQHILDPCTSSFLELPTIYSANGTSLPVDPLIEERKEELRIWTLFMSWNNPVG